MNRFNGSRGQRAPPTLALLVGITISGTLPIHVLVPALPALAAYFQAPVGAVQLTITLYIVGLAVGQVVYGPLSDRYGRRPVLLGGLTLYTVATASLAFAQTLDTFIVERMAQAMGGCAGMVLGRTIARDNLTGRDAIRRLAVLMTAMSLAPALAPVVGAQISIHFGWRAIFVVLAVAGALLLALAWFTLAETHHRRGERTAREYALSYVHLLRSRLFLAYAIGGAAGTTSFFAFVSASPFVLVDRLGVSPTLFSLIYLVIIAGSTLGAVLANHLAPRVSEAFALRVASALLVGAALFATAIYFTGLLTVTTITLAMMAYVFGNGLTSPFAMASAVNLEPAYAGAASGLFGLLQMVWAMLCTAAIAAGSADPARAMVLTLLASGCVSAVAFEYARRLRNAGTATAPAE